MKSKSYPRKKTKNIYMFQTTSLYDGEYERSLEEFKGKSVDWLRKSYPAYKRHAVKCPCLESRARLEALIAAGKEKGTEE